MRLLAIMLFAACGSRDAETASNAEPSSNESSSAEGAQSEAASTPAETPIDPTPVPVVDLQSVEDEGVSLRIRAVGDDPVELRRSVRIERQSGDSWEPVTAEYNLRTDCEETSGECLTLAAGAELSSPALRVNAGQCDAAELAPGTYRFVVQSCAPEGARPHEIQSVFTLDP